MTTIFANPGSTEVSFLTDLPEDIEFVLALHEGSVVGIATGYATARERPALVNLHTTAGLGNAVGALATARANRVPLVVIVGQQDRRHLAFRPFLAGDLEGLAGNYPVWVQQPARAQDVPGRSPEAWHEACGGRGPALVIVPSDDWAAPPTTAPWGLPRRCTGRPPCRAAWTSSSGWWRARCHRYWWSGRTPTTRTPGRRWWGWPTGSRPRSGRSRSRPGPVSPGPPAVRRAPAGRAVAAAAALGGHDLVLAVGAPVFRQYPYEEGRLVDPGTRVALVTDDAEDAHHSPVQLAVVAGPARCAALWPRGLPERRGSAAAPWARPAGPAPHVTESRCGQRT